MSDININEKAAHRAMGFFAGLLPLAWTLTLRERNQLPPENNANPVIWYSGHLQFVVSGDRPTVGLFKEYWAATRVRDTLKDTHDYAIGNAIAWPFVLGAGIAIGRFAL